MGKVATNEVHRDSEPLFNGTHGGPDGTAYILDKDAHFVSLGLTTNILHYVENETQGTYGYLRSVTEDKVYAYTPDDSALTFDNGDTYNIYKTPYKDGHISNTWCDVSRGWKINPGDKINSQGWREEDWDQDDRGRKKVFGPNQPERH